MSRILPTIQLLCRLQQPRTQVFHNLHSNGKYFLYPCLCRHAFEQQKASYAKKGTSVSMRSVRILKNLTQKKGKLKPMNYTPGSIVKIHSQMTVSELAAATKRSTDDIFNCLIHIKNGSQYDQEDSVISDKNVIKEIMKRLGQPFEIVKKLKMKAKDDLDTFRQGPPDPSVLVKRPPVVTIMGHVDHGKTTLLDALRKTNVVAQEFGGITQHIGAFSVKLPTGNQITFLDTPGHAAFSSMRARGAMVTDIVILVVAADDGVMPQTIESIQHAQKAGVPVVVAINKMDKAGADLERTKQNLLEHGIITESFGGDVQAVPISAIKGENLLELQEAVITEAELLDLKGDPKGLVEGYIIESKVDPYRGKVATVLIQRGTLKKGCILLAGDVWGKVKSMNNDKQQTVKVASPAMPVEVLGWKDLPSAGEEIYEVKTERIAQDVIQVRAEEKMREKQEKDQLAIDEKVRYHKEKYEELKNVKKEQGYTQYLKEKRKPIGLPDTPKGLSFPIIIKGDVDGSVEAMLGIIFKFESKLCQLDIIHYGVGNITQKDIETAKVFDGEVFGFNVTAPESVIKLAEQENVQVHLHNVIYKLFDELILRLNKRLPTVVEEDVIGKADVLQTFQITNDNKKKCTVAGCRCIQGELQKKMFFKVERDGEVIFDGILSSLKHHKREVDKITTNMECGLMLEDDLFSFQIGDEVTCYSVKNVEQQIDWNPGF